MEGLFWHPAPAHALHIAITSVIHIKAYWIGSATAYIYGPTRVVPHHAHTIAPSHTSAMPTAASTTPHQTLPLRHVPRRGDSSDLHVALQQHADPWPRPHGPTPHPAARRAGCCCISLYDTLEHPRYGGAHMTSGLASITATLLAAAGQDPAWSFSAQQGCCYSHSTGSIDADTYEHVCASAVTHQGGTLGCQLCHKACGRASVAHGVPLATRAGCATGSWCLSMLGIHRSPIEDESLGLQHVGNCNCNRGW